MKKGTQDMAYILRNFGHKDAEIKTSNYKTVQVVFRRSGRLFAKQPVL